MAKNPRLSQSPRALRDSTNDEMYSKGKVNLEFKDGPEPENEGARELFDKSGRVKQDRGGDTYRSV
jgi:hypothetical protein